MHFLRFWKSVNHTFLKMSEISFSETSRKMKKVMFLWKMKKIKNTPTLQKHNSHQSYVNGILHFIKKWSLIVILQKNYPKLDTVESAFKKFLIRLQVENARTSKKYVLNQSLFKLQKSISRLKEKLNDVSCHKRPIVRSCVKIYARTQWYKLHGELNYNCKVITKRNLEHNKMKLWILIGLTEIEEYRFPFKTFSVKWCVLFGMRYPSSLVRCACERN